MMSGDAASFSTGDPGMMPQLLLNSSTVSSCQPVSVRGKDVEKPAMSQWKSLCEYLSQLFFLPDGKTHLVTNRRDSSCLLTLDDNEQ